MISFKVMYREILDKFCEVFGLSLCLEKDFVLEFWRCKTSSVNFDCSIFASKLSKYKTRIWSEYCVTEEDACKDYIESMLGHCVLVELEPIKTNHDNALGTTLHRKLISIPKTLEEFAIWVDLQQNATAVSNS